MLMPVCLPEYVGLGRLAYASWEGSQFFNLVDLSNYFVMSAYKIITSF